MNEAHRLFKISTLNAANSGMQSNSSRDTPTELKDLCGKIEEAIKRRVAIGTKISYAKLQQEMMMRFENDRAINYAILAILPTSVSSLYFLLKNSSLISSNRSLSLSAVSVVLYGLLCVI